jgi:uncharacterized RDD family membrane protein YckC
MMRRFASRSSRVAVYVADTLLVALAPALFFYPAFYFLVPPQPKQNLLPLELMNPAERDLALEQAINFQQGVFQVALGTIVIFFLSFILYQTAALLSQLPDGSRRGQTFGMKAVSTRLVKLSDEPIGVANALFRSVLFSISSALFFASLLAVANLSYFLLSEDASFGLGIDEEVAVPSLFTALGIVMIHMLALIPKRSVIDYLSGTCQVALYGDLIEKEHKRKQTT